MTPNILAAHDVRLVYTEYPNGTASVTRVRESSSLVPVEYHQAYVEAQEEISRGVLAPGRPTASFACSKMSGTLESTKVANCVTERATRGTGGITRSQRRLASSGCALLERSHDRKLLTFMTTTIPPALADTSRCDYAAALKIFYKWMGRQLEAAGLDPRYIAVTEVQEKRLANHGQFALHEHIAFQGRHKGKSWAITPNQVRKAWVRALEIATGRTCPEEETKVCVDMQPVKKSVKSYLGKYLSKGTAIVKDLIERGYGEMIPATWVHRSLAMLDSFRKSTVKLYNDRAEWAAQILRESGAEYVAWARDIQILLDDGSPFTVGTAYVLQPGKSLSWLAPVT
jgi:hypothetical protein